MMQHVTLCREMKNGMKLKKKLKKITQVFECRTYKYRMYLIICIMHAVVTVFLGCVLPHWWLIFEHCLVFKLFVLISFSGHLVSPSFSFTFHFVL